MSSLRRSPKKLVRRQAEPLDYLFLRKTPGMFSMKISGVPYTWTFTVENVQCKATLLLLQRNEERFNFEEAPQ